MVHEATGGAMRELDRVMGEALRIAASLQRELVERDVVTRVLEGGLLGGGR